MSKMKFPIKNGEIAFELNDKLSKSDVKRYAIETWIAPDGNSWYTIYNDGWKECGGIINNKVTGRSTVQLPNITFSNEKYVVLLTIRWDSTINESYWDRPLNVSLKKTTSFQYYAYSNSGEIQWVCKGY